MFYAMLAILFGAAVALDQVVKYDIVSNIAPGEIVPVWDGVIHLTYVRNTGAAFSILPGGRWLFLAIMVVFLAGVIYVMAKKLVKSRLILLCLTMVCAGGFGNFIDRLRLGYVVDMFEVEFMRFAVFNVADIFVVCFSILLCIYILFFDRQPKKQEETPQ